MKWLTNFPSPSMNKTTFASSTPKNSDNPINSKVYQCNSLPKSYLWIKQWAPSLNALMTLQLESKNRNSELWENATNGRVKLKTENVRWWNLIIFWMRKRQNLRGILLSCRVYLKYRLSKKHWSINYQASNDKTHIWFIKNRS